ncbi:hypothetical protein AAJ76_3300019330 [Vairimorpha ceranae]|uniref:Uncharacterized protein n=1 Tax=Vairimorpha ceranae TaxID=40302 RepID=A0A0F9WC31_9MICR|nr:hypothetical protein AAJ76_3300019330 [Vairimorpha ceranae]KKO75076.1 hypothetical protein AAJ76_3300019330 [Vairimorpha ceranae]
MYFNYIILLFAINEGKHRHNFNKAKSMITYDKLNIPNDELEKFLRNELVEVLPLINDQIKENFRRRNIDFSNYRDFIFVKRSAKQLNGKKKVEYTITEKIVPKNRIYDTENSNISYTSIFSCVALFFLLGLSYILLMKIIFKGNFVEIINKQ